MHSSLEQQSIDVCYFWLLMIDNLVEKIYFFYDGYSAMIMDIFISFFWSAVLTKLFFSYELFFMYYYFAHGTYICLIRYFNLLNSSKQWGNVTNYCLPHFFPELGRRLCLCAIPRFLLVSLSKVVVFCQSFVASALPVGLNVFPIKDN